MALAASRKDEVSLHIPFRTQFARVGTALVLIAGMTACGGTQTGVQTIPVAGSLTTHSVAKNPAPRSGPLLKAPIHVVRRNSFGSMQLDAVVGNFPVQTISPSYVAVQMAGSPHRLLSTVVQPYVAPTPRPTPPPICKTCYCGQSVAISPGGKAVSPNFVPGPCPLSHERRVMNTTGAQDPTYLNGQAGFVVSPVDANGAALGDGSYWDAVTIYYGSATDQNVPTPPQGHNAIVTTSIAGANGNCLEVDVVYSKGLFPGVTGQDDRLQVYDYCKGDYGSALAINADFLNKYTRTFSNGNGKPQAQVQTARWPDGSWHALIFNELTGSYDDFYQTAANSLNTQFTTGYDFFSVDFDNSNNVACPAIDASGESGLRVYTGNGPDNGFTEVFALPQNSYQILPGRGPCFDPTGTGGARTLPYYTFTNNASITPNDSAYMIQMGT
jgi:hypothetical protein